MEIKELMNGAVLTYIMQNLQSTATKFFLSSFTNRYIKNPVYEDHYSTFSDVLHDFWVNLPKLVSSLLDNYTEQLKVEAAFLADARRCWEQDRQKTVMAAMLGDSLAGLVQLDLDRWAEAMIFCSSASTDPPSSTRKLRRAEVLVILSDIPRMAFIPAPAARVATRLLTRPSIPSAALAPFRSPRFSTSSCCAARR